MINTSLRPSLRSMHLALAARMSLLREVETGFPGAGQFLRQRLLAYGRLHPDVVRALVGPTGFPPPPIHKLDL